MAMRLQLDERIGGCPRYILSRDPVPEMLVPDEFRKCVVFLGGKDKEGVYKPRGTAFCVSVRGQWREFRYLVTVMHNLEKAGKSKLFIRVNSGRSVKLIPTEPDQWIMHPSRDIDVAVLPLDGVCEDIQCESIPSEAILSKNDIKEYEVGVGDEVFFTGLFPRHYGGSRNIPLVRIGNIALMPHKDEKVPVRHPSISNSMVDIEAYLIEARSVGGLSGSPVFVNLGGHRNRKKQTRGSCIFWLGVIHGHWELESKPSPEQVGDASANGPINLGIAVVIPANYIRETLDAELLVQRRKASEDKIKLSMAPTPD